jgi:hypothetical protein
MRFSKRPTAFSALVLVAAFTWAACDRSTAAPERSAGDSATPTIAYSGIPNSLQAELKRLEEAEKQRVELMREQSRPVYDSLNAVWRGAYDQSRSTLLACEPLQYAADVKIIGPDGGNLSIGPHQLIIPKGALKTYQVITGEVPVSLNVSVKLSPSGLQFVKPASIRMRYQHCVRPEGYVHRMVYINDSNEILEWPTSYDDSKLDDVWGTIKHFSKYALVSN